MAAVEVEVHLGIEGEVLRQGIAVVANAAMPVAGAATDEGELHGASLARGRWSAIHLTGLAQAQCACQHSRATSPRTVWAGLPEPARLARARAQYRASRRGSGCEPCRA